MDEWLINVIMGLARLGPQVNIRVKSVVKVLEINQFIASLAKNGFIRGAAE